MKKLFLVLILASFSHINAQIPEQLEQAIKNSDLVDVKKQLQEASLSANELLSLIDLSQQIIHCRRGEKECNHVSKNTPKQGLLFLGATLSSISLLPLSPFTLASIADRNPDIRLLFGTATILIFTIFCWNRYFQSLNDECQLLKRNFDNAVAIRQLLLLQTAKS